MTARLHGDVSLLPNADSGSLQVVRGLSAGARVFEYMALSPCIPLSGGHSIPKEQLQGCVTFQDVSFR